MKKTNFDSSTKYDMSNGQIPVGKIVHNIDEHGMDEILFHCPPVDGGDSYIMTLFKSHFDELMKAAGGLSEENETLEVSKTENTVSEEFVLRLTSIVANKEPYQETK